MVTPLKADWVDDLYYPSVILRIRPRWRRVVFISAVWRSYRGCSTRARLRMIWLMLTFLPHGC